MADSDLRQEKALGAALALAGVVVAVALVAGGVLVGRIRPAGPLELAGPYSTATAFSVEDVDSADLPTDPRALAQSRTSTATSVTTASVSATSSAVSTRTAASGGTAAGRDGVVAPGDNGSGDPGTGGTGGTTPPGTSPGPPKTVTTSSVRGTVRHAVWGTPVSGVRVTLSPLGLAASTTGSGGFDFASVPDGRMVLVSVADDGWLSTDSRMTAFHAPRTEPVDFRVYSTAEAWGRDWRDAAWWRSASAGELARAADKVGLASSAFRGLSAAQASRVLALARTGTAQERARGELLASWLDLASGRLGLDTRVSALNVSGAAAYLPAHSGALEYVRVADALVASGRADWSVLRRALTERALEGALGAMSETAPVPHQPGAKDYEKPPHRH